MTFPVIAKMSESMQAGTRSKPSFPDTDHILTVVIIGRNEGQRLKKSIVSTLDDDREVVYVDSGSTDGSVELAKSLGVDVVELDPSMPFTAARGRNAGFKHLREKGAIFSFVQFVDGDDEIDGKWFSAGVNTLAENPDVGIVAGRKRECYSERSVYNTLFEMEWDTETGEVNEVSGTCMVRADVFEQVGGFNETLIAGEDPELCLRIRQGGWKIIRLADFMGWHDANMMHFTEWWKRTVRTGHAYAEGAAMHGKSDFQHNVRQCRSNWFWGLILPFTIFSVAIPTQGLSLLLLLGYPILFFRVFRWRKSLCNRDRNAMIYAGFTVLGKLPSALGQLLYWLNRWRGKVSTLIEYKAA